MRQSHSRLAAIRGVGSLGQTLRWAFNGSGVKWAGLGRMLHVLPTLVYDRRKGACFAFTAQKTEVCISIYFQFLYNILCFTHLIDLVD